MGFPMTRRIDAAGLVIAFLLLAIAGAIWWDMSSLQLSSVYGLGPKAMPMIVAVGLWRSWRSAIVIMAFRGESARRAKASTGAPIILIIGGLAVLIALIRFGGGFILATAILFACTSAAFGRRAFLADLAIGFVISVVIYILFSKAPHPVFAGGSARTPDLRAAMDAFISLAHGLTIAIQPMNLLFALIGVLLGTAVGVLPGIGPALTVALLLPITFKLDPGGSIIMFAGIYYGGMYGGSTTAILINTPGESASMATALEGNKMAKAGRGGPALATSAIGSFVAGTIATLGLTFLAPNPRGARGQVRTGGLLRAHVRGLRHRVGHLRRFSRPRPHEPVHRPCPRARRHRHPHRPVAPRLSGCRNSSTASR